MRFRTVEGYNAAVRRRRPGGGGLYAAIAEAAWSPYLAGELRTDYAAALGRDVPALLAEACATAGLPA